jgi:GLPGLI family protein
MTNKILSIIVLIFLSNVAIGQNTFNGTVTYEAKLKKINIDEELKGKNISDEIKQHLLNEINNTKSINYILKFTKTESKFIKEDVLEVKQSSKVLEILAGRGEFYSNPNSKIILEEKETLGSDFLISYPLIEWKLTNESKKIGDYLCYKAISAIKVENSTGIQSKGIIAWYTTKIPVHFGPNRFCGLPGLILELQSGKLVYKALKIELNSKKEIKIKKPTKGKKITTKELNILARKLREDRRKM